MPFKYYFFFYVIRPLQFKIIGVFNILKHIFEQYSVRLFTSKTLNCTNIFMLQVQ